jgi:hypothetical protein
LQIKRGWTAVAVAELAASAIADTSAAKAFFLGLA